MRAPNRETSPSGLPGVSRVDSPATEPTYEPPRYEVICLACEISSYAPDGDWPLV